MRDLGFDEVVGWSFTDPGEAGAAADPRRTTRAPSAIAISNPLSEDQSVMRTTLLGSLLDAARHNLARGAERVALVRVRPRLPAPTASRRRRGRWPATSPGERPAPPTSRTGSAASRSAPLAPGGWRGERRAGRLLRAQGRARGARRAARRRGSRSSRGERAVPAPGPRGRGRARRRRRRLDRRGPPARLPRLGPRGARPASSSTSRRWSPPRRPARRSTRT